MINKVLGFIMLVCTGSGILASPMTTINIRPAAIQIFRQEDSRLSSPGYKVKVNPNIPQTDNRSLALIIFAALENFEGKVKTINLRDSDAHKDLFDRANNLDISLVHDAFYRMLNAKEFGTFLSRLLVEPKNSEQRAHAVPLVSAIEVGKLILQDRLISAQIDLDVLLEMTYIKPLYRLTVRRMTSVLEQAHILQVIRFLRRHLGDEPAPAATTEQPGDVNLDESVTQPTSDVAVEDTSATSPVTSKEPQVGDHQASVSVDDSPAVSESSSQDSATTVNP